jgi:hypothetical protein
MVVWETPATGDKMAPFEHPEQHLDRVWFSSTFDYYKVAHRGTHSLTHAAVAAHTTPFDNSPTGSGWVINGPNINFGGQVVKADQILCTHNLGYVPRYMVALGSTLLPDYYPVQRTSTTLRTVSFYATETEIRCIDIGTSSGSVAVAATTLDYDLLLFREPGDGYDPDLPVFSAKQGILGQGIVRATDSLLRRSDDDDASPFDIILSPALDIDRGFPCWVLPDGTFAMGNYAGTPPTPAIIQCVVT